MKVRPILTFGALLLGAATLASCGDDDADNGAGAALTNGDGVGSEVASGDSNGGRADDGAWPPEDLPGTGEAGSVTVDGVAYGIDVVRSCDLADFPQSDRIRQFEVQAAGVVDPDANWPDAFELAVYTGETTSPPKDSQGVDWAGPEGRYDAFASGFGADNWTVGSRNVDGPPVELGGDRITGELTLSSHMGRPPVDIAFDFAQPTGPAVVCH